MKLSARILAMAMALVAMSAVAATGDELLRFDRNNFDTWTYTRNDVKLNNENILAKKINIFTNGAGVAYTLVSPEIDLSGIGQLDIVLDAYCSTAGAGYDLRRNSPTFELLDGEGGVVASQFLLYTKELTHHVDTLAFALPSGIEKVRLRVACHDADANNALAVFSIIVTEGIGSQPITYERGDINLDGSVNAGDVSALYGIILGSDTGDTANADLNNDGSVNAGDISTLYAIILGN